MVMPLVEMAEPGGESKRPENANQKVELSQRNRGLRNPEMGVEGTFYHVLTDMTR